MKHMKDTCTIEYQSEKHKKFIIDTFSKPSNGGYVQLSDDYLESKSLQKGIILKYEEFEAERGVLTHSIPC